MVLDGDDPAKAHARDRLATERVGWLTTVRPDGQPQTMPIWFAWDDGEIVIFSDYRARRNRNIAANPRVAFHLDTNASGGDVVAMEAEARIDTDTPGPHAHAGYCAKYADWIVSWFETPEKMAEVYHVTIRIRPTRLLAFGT